jgi:hypothetical protein
MGDSFGSQDRPAGDTVATPDPMRPAPAPEGVDGGTPPSAAPPPDVVLIQGSPATVGPPGRRRTVVGSPAVITGSTNGIPVTVLSAYRDAVAALNTTEPGCHIPVALLAGIGKVESGHARGGRVSADGTAVGPILGPVLDGVAGTAAIPDTDGGVLDGDTVWDRAVGPMQFIPSTWRRWASDGNGDGRQDPENIFDASLASARYLCAGGRDLSTSTGVASAILSYNNSTHYLRLVLAWMNDYSGAVLEVADITGPFDGSGAHGGASTRSAPPSARQPGSTAPTSVVTTTTVLAPAPSTTIAVVPAPLTTAPAPTDAAPHPPPPPAAPVDPVTGLLCGVQDVVGTGLGLLGGLLGGGAPTRPAPGCPSPDVSPDLSTTATSHP